VEDGVHVEHVGRLVALPVVEAQLWQDTDTAPVTVSVGDPKGEYRTITSGAELRAEAARVRASGARLDALADEFDAIREAAAGAPSGQGPVPLFEPDKIQRATETARTWSIRTTTGATVTGYLPEWAETDPSKDGVRNDRLEVHVVDVYHRRDYDGPTVTVDMPGFDKDRYVGEYQILAPVMRCTPHAEDPADRVPVVLVDAMPGSDHYIGPLDPAGVMDLADKLRAHAAALDDVAALLQDAREDWVKNGGAR
jgi:hypothetical protein